MLSVLITGWANRQLLNSSNPVLLCVVDHQLEQSSHRRIEPPIGWCSFGLHLTCTEVCLMTQSPLHQVKEVSCKAVIISVLRDDQ